MKFFRSHGKFHEMRKRIHSLPFIYWIIFFGSIFLICFTNLFFYSKVNSTRKLNCQCPIQCNGVHQLKRFSIDEMTFISCPRPLTKDRYNSTKLSLSSWLAASPKTSILLFVNKTEFDPDGSLSNELSRLFGANRVRYAESTRHDLKGVPYIDDWFREGIKQSESKYVSFINTDIPLSKDWLKRVKQVYSVMGDEKPIVMIGQRIDFDLDKNKFHQLRFDQEHLLSDIDEMVLQSKHSPHSPYGVDSFTFQIENLPFDSDKILPFIMGRYNWDNWIVGWLNTFADTVTFNLDPPIYHINHKRHNFNPEDSKVAVNHHFKKANKDYFGSNYDTKWEIVDQTLVKRSTKESFVLPNNV